MQSNGTNLPKIDKDLYWGQSEAQRNQSWELVHLHMQWSTCGSCGHTGLTSKAESFFLFACLFFLWTFGNIQKICRSYLPSYLLGCSLRPSTIRVNKHVRNDEAFLDTTVNFRKQTNKHQALYRHQVWQHSHCQSEIFSIQWFVFVFTTFSIVDTYWEWCSEQRNCKITIFSLLASSK